MANKNYLAVLNKKGLSLVKKVGGEAKKFRLKAYLVGGIVRDLILKKENLDLDVVVEGDAIRLAKHLSKKFDMELVVHHLFKTATLFTKRGERIDLTSARREFYPQPGALPAVSAGPLEADLLRRDFTINALAISIPPDTFGELVDHYCGLEDLNNGVIRIFHDSSFVDDPTRVLRAVRFEQRFDFDIEEKTLRLLKEAIKKKYCTTVKPPRYFNELKKIFMEDNPVRALKRLHDLGGLNFWNYRITFNSRSMSSLHRRITQLRRKKYYKKFNDWWMVYFMAFMKGVARKKRIYVYKQIQLNNELVKALEATDVLKKVTRELSAKALKKSDIYKILKPYPQETIIYFRLRSSKQKVNKRIDCYFQELMGVSLKINGEDIKKKGVKGKQIGRVLEAVLDQKMDRGLRTKTQELKVAQQIING